MIEKELPLTQSGWGEIPLTPEIATPEKRLSALLNIAQNGAETLTVLTMAPDTKQWEGYGIINSNMNRQVGLRVVTNTATRAHLVLCIEPVGAAARSTLDDKDWALTEFGIKIKPALIFVWQKLLELNLDSMALLGSQSKGKKDEDGNLVTTPPMVRTQILLALTNQDGVRVVDFCQSTNLTITAISTHLEHLQNAGLVDLKSSNLNAGQSVTFFKVTPLGERTTTWPTYQNKRGWSRTQVSAYVEETVQELTRQGRPVTTAAVTSFDNKDIQHLPRQNYTNVSTVLSHFVRGGFLERGRFKEHDYSDVRLTTFGRQVVEAIINPLVLWSQNDQAVAEINQIAARLKVNPDAFTHLYPQIANSFIEHSPRKNANREAKTQKIRDLIKRNPNQLTRSDLARQLNVRCSTVSLIIKTMLESGEIVQTKAEKGNRVLLSPGHPN